MLQRSDEVALLRAVLLDNCVSDNVAALNLEDARRLGVDPLDYCAHRFGLGNKLVWQRAAHWAGYGYSDVIPRQPRGEETRQIHIERLGQIRTLRVHVLGREVLFGAPGFAAILNLGAGRGERPDLARRLCIVPPEAIDTALTVRHEGDLMDEARQGLTRRWGGITASTALPKSARWTFVAVLVALIGLVMAAGTTGRAVLLPLVAALLIAPGLLRAIAALPRRMRAGPVRLLADWELPSYSVMIPLRDEASMVPLLHRAMSALDYPALCIKRTSLRVARIGACGHCSRLSGSHLGA